MRDRYPPGVPCWVDTGPPDTRAAMDFYGGLFGWTFEDRGGHYVARLGDGDVAGVGSHGTAPASVWNTYVSVDSADEATAAAHRAGGTVLVEPFDVRRAGRMAVIADPAGASFRVWQAGDHIGAQRVNGPGTWNWSNLNTHDPEGAKTFYAAVFGWEASTVHLGGKATMWRVPGYGEFLEVGDPNLRGRQQSQGAPEGFEDAIGWMLPLTGAETGDDARPHWSVTFAVGDTDAIADRAAALGGTVVVAPYDAGPASIAVLTDAQGAAFSVSQFKPGA